MQWHGVKSRPNVGPWDRHGLRKPCVMAPIRYTGNSVRLGPRRHSIAFDPQICTQNWVQTWRNKKFGISGVGP